MKLSLVTTLYSSAAHVEEFCSRASIVARQFAGTDYEIVLVNDGSPDNSLALALGIAETDSHYVVVDLSRNFGHHKAMMTGLAHAKGDLVFLIDSDLEEAPEYLQGFSEQMLREQCDVVYGVQEKRKGNRFEQWAGSIFYRIFNFLSDFEITANLVTARLMTRRYVDALLLHKEREVFIAGLWAMTGYNQQPHMVKKLSHGSSTYSLRRKIAAFVNGITSFSNTPLVGIFYIGIGISFIAMLHILYLLVHWAFLASPLSGWTSVMASIWLLGGMIISFIGVVGIYLSKVFSETKQRPYTIVRQVYAKRVR